jgi:hypothetical protein
MTPREGDEMVVLRPAHLERLVIAVSEYVGQLSSQLQEMTRPGQF